MSLTATVQLFYALLAILAFAFIAIVVITRFLAAVSSSAQRVYNAIGGVIEPNAISMAFIVALLATIGSLYFSEIAHFEPCRLCWYQRIAMYPLVVILAIAAIRRDDEIRIYARVLAAVGAVVSTYHLALEWIPALDTGACGVGPSCAFIWFREFGLISLPMLALIAFLLILTLLSVRSPFTDHDEPAIVADIDRSAT